jgi:hypothetical protein
VHGVTLREGDPEVGRRPPRGRKGRETTTSFEVDGGRISEAASRAKVMRIPSVSRTPPRGTPPSRVPPSPRSVPRRSLPG